ncbi:MAG: arylsulfatase B [Chlamydiales bacterium]|jgi:arylsulfatase B
MRRFFSFLSACLLCSASAYGSGTPNYLIMLADDIGVDMVGAYGEHPDPARTPNIDRMAQQGILFRNAYSEPICSASRAALLTGRFGVRTGLGSNPKKLNADNVGLTLDEILLPELLQPFGYGSAVCGKWHLADFSQGPMHPIESGFDFAIGSLGNLSGMETYKRWKRSVNGTTRPSYAYATTDAVDNAIRAIRHFEGRDKPWVVLVAFNAPHHPLHAPPGYLHSYPLTGDPQATPELHTKAMVEAMDTEIGRLLAGLGDAGDNTLVIFAGDNGSTEEAITAPFDPEHGKGTVYEGGINVPFIVSGQAVVNPGRQVEGLIHLRDIYPTLAEMSGVPIQHPVDGLSLLPYLSASTPDSIAGSLRDWAYSESFKPNIGSPGGGHSFRRRAVRNTDGFKLVVNWSGMSESFMFDLNTDPFETTNLLHGQMTAQEQAAFDELTSIMERIKALR